MVLFVCGNHWQESSTDFGSKTLLLEVGNNRWSKTSTKRISDLRMPSMYPNNMFEIATTIRQLHIISCHFKYLVEFPAITVQNLRKSLDKLNAIVRGIRICNIDTEKMWPLITYLVVIKLLERIRTVWENSVLHHSIYPSFQLLSTYLQNRVSVIESMHFEPACRNIGCACTTSVEKPSDKH